jgi:hypothetical protein
MHDSTEHRWRLRESTVGVVLVKTGYLPWVIELTSLTSDRECETLILPREKDIRSSPTTTVDYVSHLMYCYLPQIVLNVYIWMPETAKLSGNCTYCSAWSLRKVWRHTQQTTCTLDDVTIACSREWKIYCLLFSWVSSIVDLLSLCVAYHVRRLHY